MNNITELHHLKVYVGVKFSVVEFNLDLTEHRYSLDLCVFYFLN